MAKKPKGEGYGESVSRVKLLTAAQRDYSVCISHNVISIATGYPGTGKSFVACYEALKAYQRGDVTKIIITKPCVEVGDNPLGFLPGDIEEKMAPFVRSIKEIFECILGVPQARQLFADKVIEVLPLAFLRGLTLDHVFVVADEMQNASYLQIKTLLTRIGEGCKYVLNGDIGQTDYSGVSGLPIFLKLLQGVAGVGTVDFAIEDIVRSDMLKFLVIAIYEYEQTDEYKKMLTVAR